MQYHCIIRQQHPIGEAVGYEQIMKNVITTVNYIGSRVLNHKLKKKKTKLGGL
jgi:hypothetical protein